jgi:hemerythrin-like domain-containing protein
MLGKHQSRRLTKRKGAAGLRSEDRGGDHAAQEDTMTQTRRPSRAAVPALPSFDQLDDTHRRVMHALAQLTELLDQIDARIDTPDTRALAASICGFFDDTARAHHAAEEKLVFPTLLASDDPELVQHVRRLQQDHGWLEEDWLEIAPQLRAVAESQNWVDIDFLRAATQTFTELYREHIALEETVVYPASRRRQRQ